MTNDQARLILLFSIAGGMPIGIYHRLRARTGERLDRLQEGWPILLSLRPLGAAFVVGLAAFLIKPSSMAWASLHLPNWARWTGIGFSAAAIVLVTWMFHTLGHNLTDTVVARRDATLITSGPYYWVRHPMYLALALGVIGNALIADSGYLAIVGTAAFLVVVARTRIEERNLVACFGRDYEAYMKTTGRFLPRIGRGQS